MLAQLTRCDTHISHVGGNFVSSSSDIVVTSMSLGLWAVT